MADVVLKNGVEAVFDLENITLEEYEKIDTMTNLEVIALLSRVSGVEQDVIHKLSINDFKRFLGALHKKIREPLANPT